jgi:hypothetical protein
MRRHSAEKVSLAGAGLVVQIVGNETYRVDEFDEGRFVLFLSRRRSAVQSFLDSRSSSLLRIAVWASNLLHYYPATRLIRDDRLQPCGWVRSFARADPSWRNDFVAIIKICVVGASQFRSTRIGSDPKNHRGAVARSSAKPLMFPCSSRTALTRRIQVLAIRLFIR